MEPEKYQQLLNTKKFERISFAADYITQILKMQKEVSIEDFACCMSRLYSEAFLDGQCDSLEKMTTYAFLELDDLYSQK